MTEKRGKGGKRIPILIGGSGNHRIPEAFSAFCIIVSFTAANTSRIFVVSVACVRLQSDWDAESDREAEVRAGERVLWINAEPGSICLHKLQQYEFGSFVYVRSANVLRTVALQWNLGSSRSAHRALDCRSLYLWYLIPEHVYLVHEENNRRPQEPS